MSFRRVTRAAGMSFTRLPLPLSSATAQGPLAHAYRSRDCAALVCAASLINPMHSAGVANGEAGLLGYRLL